LRAAVFRSVLALIAVLSGALAIVAFGRSALVAPPPTPMIVDRHGAFIADVESDDAQLGFWDVDPLPERVAEATIAIEDRRFWKHPGVDPAAIGRALWQDMRSGRRVSGASTLAMQIARMQSPSERSLFHKLIEATTALALTMRHGRRPLLSHYLRIAPYGNRIHGIELASRRYLDKPSADLSWSEIAFLAAIPQSPSRMNPYDRRGYQRARARGEQILDLLETRGVLSHTEWMLAREQIGHLMIMPKATRPSYALHAIVRLKSELGRTRSTRVQGWGGFADPGPQVRRIEGPPIMRSSLDLELQHAVLQDAEDVLRALAKDGAEDAAVIVVDRETDGVLAYLGSVDYFDSSKKGAIDYASTPRSSGSTLKPFIYALALDRRAITPATILDDQHRGPGGMEDADHDQLGPLLPRIALAGSRNVPAADVMRRVGVDETYEVFATLGLHDRSTPASHYGAGLAVGALPVTLESLMAAYTTLIHEGNRSRLSWWVDDRRAAERKRVFSEASTRQIALFLSDPLARLPTFPRLGPLEYPFPVAVKTGTSVGYRDAWTIAYSRKFLIGAWIGRADVRPMNKLSGSRSAAKLVRRVMMRLQADEVAGLADLAFPPPEGHRPVRICALSGEIATPRCEHSIVEYFRPGEEPMESCGAHAIDGASMPLLSKELGAPSIVEPEQNARIIEDPEAPAGEATMRLSARADPRVPELVWYVDGRPYGLAKRPFDLRWTLAKGRHEIVARIPFTPLASRPVRIEVE
jgi:penicillin-binding protein 1C